MAQLLLCPSCGGKLSSNATVCPHCGETEFYSYTYKTIREECPHCHGSGLVLKTLYSSDIHSGFHALPAQISWLRCNGGCAFFTVTDSRGVRCEMSVAKSHPHLQAIAKSIKEGNFILEYSHDSFILRYDPQYCPECNGYGEIETSVVASKTDLRKRS